MDINYYAFLGVPLFCDDQQQIKRAYISQVKVFHPDANIVPLEIALEKTQQLNKIYATLKDPTMKKAYDISLGRKFEPPTSEAERPSAAKEGASPKAAEKERPKAAEKAAPKAQQREAASTRQRETAGPKGSKTTSTKEPEMTFDEAVKASRKKYERFHKTSLIDVFSWISIGMLIFFPVSCGIVTMWGERMGIDMEGDSIIYVFGGLAVAIIALCHVASALRKNQQRKRDRADAEAYTTEDVVYTSKTSRIYHRSTCIYAHIEVPPILLRYVGDREPCTLCRPPRRK